jgi:hypothetical protein
MRPEIVRSLSTTRLSTESKGFLSRQNSKDSQKLQRPKSVNNSRTNGGSRLLREAIIDEEKNGSRRKAGLDSGADIPPLPSISRSSLLKDFKNGFTRRKIQSNNTETKSRKQSSHLKAKTLDSVPESQHGNHASSSSKKKGNNKINH